MKKNTHCISFKNHLTDGFKDMDEYYVLSYDNWTTVIRLNRSKIFVEGIRPSKYLYLLLKSALIGAWKMKLQNIKIKTVTEESRAYGRTK